MPAKGPCPAVYGPVHSRRHGLSLGINLGASEKKVCTWGCVYCQCGFGARDVPREDEIPSAAAVIASLRESLGTGTRPDSVTFAGNSEPTAHPEFLEIVRQARKLKYAMRATWALNVLSNGSELDKNAVVAACDLLDEAWIKLDCATDELFRRLNRPVFRVGSVHEHVARIKRLKEPRIQTLLWRSQAHPQTSNFSEENLHALLNAYSEIRPVEIHLTTVKRETALAGLQPVSAGDLDAFAARIRELGLKVNLFP